MELTSHTQYDLAEDYHRHLPARLRTYLRETRGLTDATIGRFLLGWSGSRITVPVFDRQGRFACFKLAKDPEDTTDSPKMLATPGVHAELYGWEHVAAKAERLIICEGEFDRLVLESHDFAAVTSTGGALTFRSAWADALRVIPNLYVCFDRDDAGRLGAERVARLIPHVRIVELPETVGEGGDVTDWFVRLGRTREDFEALLAASQPLPPERLPMSLPLTRGSGRSSPDPEIAALKASVPLVDLVARSVELQVSGQTYVARCPFHNDHTPSFVVYPATQTFHCYGCQAHGDVLTFLMRVESLTFPEALDVLRELAH